MSYKYKVSIQYDVIDGLKPIFTHIDGPNPFDISEWPEIRTQLRSEVVEDVPEEFESYLHSNRVGESYEYTIGHIIVSEDGALEEKQYDASVKSLKDAFEKLD